MSKPAPHFSPLGLLHPLSAALIGMLNKAMEGHGTLAVKASKKGISLHLDGKLWMRGKTPLELYTALSLERAKAEQKEKGTRKP